jgi:hypothetical protein
MKTPIQWYREMYQKGSDAFAGTADIAAIQADALDGLRDRVAASALAGLLMRDVFWSASAPKAQAVYYADTAYTLADAMMARRATQPTTGAPAPTTKGQ